MRWCATIYILYISLIRSPILRHNLPNGFLTSLEGYLICNFDISLPPINILSRYLLFSVFQSFQILNNRYRRSDDSGVISHRRQEQQQQQQQSNSL